MQYVQELNNPSRAIIEAGETDESRRRSIF
jgi:hypothetical protein